MKRNISRKKIRVPFEYVISSISLFVACVAIFQTCSLLEMQRVHNFNSVKPISNFRFSNYENKIGFYIENKGVGPLIVKRIKVYKKVNIHNFKSNIIDWMPRNPSSLFWSDFIFNLNGAVIVPNEEKALIELLGNVNDSVFTKYRDVVKEELKSLVIELNYTDIYNNKFPVEKRHL